MIHKSIRLSNGIILAPGTKLSRSKRPSLEQTTIKAPAKPMHDANNNEIKIGAKVVAAVLAGSKRSAKLTIVQGTVNNYISGDWFEILSSDGEHYDVQTQQIMVIKRNIT